MDGLPQGSRANGYARRRLLLLLALVAAAASLRLYELGLEASLTPQTRDVTLLNAAFRFAVDPAGKGASELVPAWLRPRILGTAAWRAQLPIGGKMDAPLKLVLLVETREGYATLCRLLTQGRRRSAKGEYRPDAAAIDEIVLPGRPARSRILIDA